MGEGGRKRRGMMVTDRLGENGGKEGKRRRRRKGGKSLWGKESGSWGWAVVGGLGGVGGDVGRVEGRSYEC